MEVNQVDLLSPAVFGYFEQVQDSQKAGGASQLWSDVGQADGLDGVYFDLAFFHGVTLADADVRAGPEADGAGDFAAADAIAQALGEDHGESLRREGRRLIRGGRCGQIVPRGTIWGEWEWVWRGLL